MSVRTDRRALVSATALSLRARVRALTVLVARARGRLRFGERTQNRPRPSEAREGEDERVEALEVPKLREVETDRGRLEVAVVSKSAREPGRSALDRVERRRDIRCDVAIRERFEREARLLDARSNARFTSPAPVRSLRLDDPADRALPKRLRLGVPRAHSLRERDDDSRGAVGRVCELGRRFVSEP